MDAGFMELMRLQDSDVMISRPELRDGIRAHGRNLPERTLAYYTDEGLLPKAARFGRAAAYPGIMVELTLFVVDARERGLSVDAVRQLVTLWKVLVGERQKLGQLRLATLEDTARTFVTSPEASSSIQWLVEVVLHTGCMNCVGSVLVVDKKEQLIDQSDSSSEWINFMLTKFDDELQQARLVGYSQLSLPGLGLPAEDDPRTVVLGTPPGTQICYDCEPVLQCVKGHEDLNEAPPSESEAAA